jgi:hypothetical protein
LQSILLRLFIAAWPLPGTAAGNRMYPPDNVDLRGASKSESYGWPETPQA